MARIFAVMLGARCQARLRAAVELEAVSGARHEVVSAPDWEAAFEAAQAGPVHLVVFAPPAAQAPVDLALPTRFRTAFPTTALLPYGRFGPEMIPALLLLAEIGVRNAVVEDGNDSPSALREQITSALASAVPTFAVHAFSAGVPVSLQGVVQFVLAEGWRPVSPPEVARRYHRHPKTLREHLRRAGLPPTEKLIVWARLVHVALFLQDRGRTVENVADALGFASSAALRQQVRRYIDLPVGRLVSDDGVSFLASGFSDRKSRRDWSLPGLRTEARRSEEG